MWCIPQVDAQYVARMEDVLDLYAEEPDPRISLLQPESIGRRKLPHQHKCLQTLVHCGCDRSPFG